MYTLAGREAGETRVRVKAAVVLGLQLSPEDDADDDALVVLSSST